MLIIQGMVIEFIIQVWLLMLIIQGMIIDVNYSSCDYCYHDIS